MPKTPYCAAHRGEDYPLLLRFSRISKAQGEDVRLGSEPQAVVQALKSSTALGHPSLRHILPLVYHNTGLGGIRDQLPAHVQGLLKEQSLLLIGREMYFKQFLVKILDLLKSTDVAVILLKGAAFAGTLYPAKAPRIGADIDLLVKECDFDQVCMLMETIMEPVLLDVNRVATHATLFERVFIPKDGNGPIVEIHRGLTNPAIFRIAEQDLWAASTISPVYDSDLVRILSAEDTLLHLAVHAFRDLDFCNHNLLDAHEVWCQWQPDLDVLVQRAEQWGARKVLFYLLHACKAVMATPVPDSVLEEVRPGCLAGRINTKILQSAGHANTTQDSFRYRCLQMLSQLTFPDRLVGGIAFQFLYGKTRVQDWLMARQRSKDLTKKW